MTNPTPRYTIEPFIGNGKPQWAVLRATFEYPKPESGYRIGDRHCGPSKVLKFVCAVDTEAEARALIAHMEKASEAL